MPLVAELDLVYLYVRDFDRSVRFYRDVLGFPLVLRPRSTWAECELPNGLRFAINKAGDYQPPTPRTAELSLRTASLDDVRALLTHAGVATTSVEHDEWGDHFHFFDPDGYRLSVYVVHQMA